MVACRSRKERKRWKIPVIWRVEKADREDVWGDRLEDDYGPPLYVSFARSKSRQTCCVAAFDVAADLSEYLVTPSPWAFLVTLLLKLRDLSLVEARCLVESEKDLMEPEEREELSRVMLVESIEYEKSKGLAIGAVESTREEKVGLLGKIGGFFFGGDDADDDDEEGRLDEEAGESDDSDDDVDLTNLAENDYVWDCAPLSDEEGEEDGGGEEMASPIHDFVEVDGTPISPMRMITNANQKEQSRRSRLRKQLTQQCNLADLARQTKYYPDNTLLAFVEGVKAVIAGKEPPQVEGDEPAPDEDDEFYAGGSWQTAAEMKRICGKEAFRPGVVSMGSKAYAEVLLCEVALRNKDRLDKLWPALAEHYENVLGKTEYLTFAVEKCASSLLRIICATERAGDAAWGRLKWGLNLVTIGCDRRIGELLSGHVVEALSRLCTTLVQSGDVGWRSDDGQSVWEFCGIFDALRYGLEVDRYSADDEEDDDEEEDEEEGEADGGEDVEEEKKFKVLVKGFRTMYSLLHAGGIKVPLKIKEPICALVHVASGVDGRWGGNESSLEEWNYRSKVAVAGLDLLMVMYNKDGGVGVEGWKAVVEALAEVSMAASTTTIRQHSLNLLTSIVIDRADVGQEELMIVLGEVCVPVCEERITNILR